MKKQKEIRNVTQEGIEYIDEFGETHFVDFEKCHQNFLSFRQKELGSLYSGDLRQHDKKRKCVGHRRFSHSYFEFYTIPPTRFEELSVGKFYEVGYKIRKAGWWTIDGD